MIMHGNFLFPVLLIAGKWQRTGGWLMWIGASCSAYVLASLRIVASQVDEIFLCPDAPITLIHLGWIGTAILLPLCDLMLILDGFRGRKALARTAV